MGREFPTITAHTGCEGTTENTIASAMAGFDLGADIVEVDVRATGDGHLVLAHNDRVRFPDGDSVSVRGSTLADLEPARGAGVLITLDELFDAILPFGGMINLDIKDDASVPIVIGNVVGRGVETHVLLTGCETERARNAMRLNPGLTVYLNTDFQIASGGESIRDPIAAACDDAAAMGCAGINIEHNLCSHETVETARLRGLLVSVWTVSPQDGFRHYVEMGVDNVTTRSVAALAELRDQLR